MTENVYVIKVKTKPPLSSLYPSERRYSASTVGGLSLVHFGLGALSLLLGILAVSLQGPILSVACMVPSVTGLLAWRRWYIDRNISIFFYGSLFSLVAAVLCFIVTIFDVAAVSGNTGATFWPLENILNAPNYPPHPAEDPANRTHVDSIATSSGSVSFNISGNQDPPNVNRAAEASVLTSAPRAIELDVSDHDYDLKAEAPLSFEASTMAFGEILRSEDANVTRTVNSAESRTKTFWRDARYEDTSHTRILLTLNVLMVSLLEASWSLLSAKIAFRGMTNGLSESGNNVLVGSKATRLNRKPPAPKPDILDHNRQLSESFQSLTSLQGLAAVPGPRLPLPESNREFRERVERFLANQATHRVVEGA